MANKFDTEYEDSEVIIMGNNKASYPRYTYYIYLDDKSDSPDISVLSTNQKNLHIMLNFIMDRYHCSFQNFQNYMSCEMLQFKPEDTTYAFNSLTGDTMYQMSDVPEKYFLPAYNELIV